MKYEELSNDELDAEIAMKLFEWQEFPYLASDCMPFIKRGHLNHAYCPPGDVHANTVRAVPKYSSDLLAAFEVVDKLKSHDVCVSLYCRLNAWEVTADDYEKRSGFTEHESLPRAICVAALQAMAPQKERAV